MAAITNKSRGPMKKRGANLRIGDRVRLYGGFILTIERFENPYRRGSGLRHAVFASGTYLVVRNDNFYGVHHERRK